MDSFEPKKLALIRIMQILRDYSDFAHPLTQEDIAGYLEKGYGIVIERKAISRNISLLKEAGMDIQSTRVGSYLDSREFEDSELHMLIDGVLCSKHITAKHSADLIERLCGLSNKYFRAHVKNTFSVNEWNKTDNQNLFYNIELIDDAIEQCRQIRFDYNKYGTDRKLHKTSTQEISPYQLILHNQRYYLMGHNEYWKNMLYLRLDHITNMEIIDKKATPLRSVAGYENGIDFKELSSALPYMYADKIERVEFVADAVIVDQIVDWFGEGARFTQLDDQKVKVDVKVSISAMEYWAMQYINYVEITAPEDLRSRIREKLEGALQRYSDCSDKI